MSDTLTDVDNPSYAVYRHDSETMHRRGEPGSEEIEPACVDRLHNVSDDTGWLLTRFPKGGVERAYSDDRLCGHPECFGDDDSDTCPTCEEASWSFETDGSLIPVWEDMDDYQSGEGPDYIGCTDCHTMQAVGEDTDE